MFLQKLFVSLFILFKEFPEFYLLLLLLKFSFTDVAIDDPVRRRDTSFENLLPRL